MRHRSSSWIFYLTVALLTAGDNALLTGIIWISLRITMSSALLGVVLCLSVAMPFALEGLLGNSVNRISLGRLVLIRCIVFSSIVVLAALGAVQHVLGFLFVALAVGMTDYFTITGLETENTKRVIAGDISSEAASKKMQTAIQAGSFAGALLGGLLIGRVTDGLFIIGLGALGSLASVSLLSPPSGRRTGPNIASTDGNTMGVTGSHPRPGGLESGTVLPFLLCLGFIGFHIGAFNSMVPIVYQRLNGWDAAVFGLAAGLAGIGAFLVAVLPTIATSRLTFPILIVAVDAILVLSPSAPLSVLAAFLVGFSINHVRVSIRAKLIEKARTDADAERIGSRTAFYFLSFQAAAPLVLTALTSGRALGGSYAPLMMITSGFLLCGAALWTGDAPRINCLSGR